MSDGESAIRMSISVVGDFVVGDHTLLDTLSRVTKLACLAIARADMAGVALLVADTIRTAASTDAVVPVMDSLERDTGVGPSLDAVRDQRPYRIGSTADEPRWPGFASEAASHGIVSTLSVPMVAHHESVGALTLYSLDGTFSDDDQELGRVFATQAALAVAYSYARELGYHLGEAMRSRAVIEQAKGVLIAREGVTPEEGFRTLVTSSNRQNLKLRDIAAQIVRDAQEGVTPDGAPQGS
jgi:GAF domain-containing protein